MQSMSALLAAAVDQALLGPLAALVLALLFIGLFYKGLILPRNTVPREDYKQLQDVNASYAEGLKLLTTSVNELVAVVRHVQRNGGVG